MIILGVVISLIGDTGLGTPIIQIVSGSVIEAVSGLFFVQSNKARGLLVAFFDKLREDRKLEEALRFARDMEPGPRKQLLQTALAASFSGSVEQNIVELLCKPIFDQDGSSSPDTVSPGHLHRPNSRADT